jgi:amino acid adenylation domain-containing protein
MNRRQVEDAYPLSPMQQGMLFHALSAPGSGAYFEQLTCELAGDLDVTLFERAWRQVLARHPALRSAFDWESMDEPVQVVIQQPDLPFEQQDWRGLDAGEQRSRLRSTLAADQARGFDLAAAPLVRIALFQLGERRFRLVWSHHHLILDGWSMPILFREFFTCYRAARAGATAAALPPPRPYRDYIAWLERQDLAAAAAFWRRQLAGFASPTPIGRGRRAPGDGPPGAYGERELRLSAVSTAALQALAQRHQVTVNSLLEACWALLLSRHSGERDVLFGVVVSGRPAELAEVESMVGLFLNTLALRLELTDREPLMPFVRRVQAKLTELLGFEWSPLADVQGWSDVARGLPLFESIVVFQNYPVEAIGGERDGGLAIHDYQVREHTNYPLNLLVGLAGAPAANPSGAGPAAGLVLAISYDTLRFDGATVDEMLRQLGGLLEQATRSPDAPLDSFSLITPEARRWLPDPAMPIPAPHHDPLARQFRTAAARWPAAPAVEQGDRAWSYGELAAAAEALALRLTSTGIARGEPVAVRGVRSFGLVAGALGVLLAGGALLPLDRRLPAERQRRMLEQAGARRLLRVGEPAAADDGLDGLALAVLAVDPDSGRPTCPPGGAAAAAGPGASGPLPEPAPDDPAYVFFTSGTTGVPNAVVGRQSGLGHFLDWQRTTFDVGPGDRVAQLTGLSFDVVLRELFLPLTSGAVLCLPDEDLAVAGAAAPAWLAQSGITLLHTVPSLALAWIASGAGEVRLPRLRCVFFAGEPLTGELVNRWRAAFDHHGEVINLYGPTETTLAKCWYRVAPEPRPGVQPLGAPLPDTQALILADGGRRCGALETGEIVVRTPFRTLGFLQPETGGQHRFVANPFRDDPADLLYRSGDLGRFGADGLLEILGRRDGQLKIRGVRVEPAEIERALRRHPGVREVAVVADGAGGGRLVACVVPQVSDGSSPSPAELGRLARESLPAPIVPSHFVLVAALPLTANGKLDRARLLEIAGSRQAADAPAVPPRDPIELEIAAIWEEMLGTPVGVTESFFMLGGHSLLVAPMLARVERRFDHRLSLAGFLPAPTVEHLASALRARPAEIARSPLLPLRPQGSGTPLFCVHPLGGSALCYQALARALAELLPEQPFYGLDEQFQPGSNRRFEDLEEMAATYLAAVRQVRPAGPYLLAGWSFGGSVAFEMARQLAGRGEEVAMLALFDSFAPAASAPSHDAALDDAAIILELVGPQVELTPEMLRGLAPEAQLRRLLELGRRSNLLPPDYDVETLRELVAMVRMNGRLAQQYRPRAYPGRLTFFKAELDADADGRQARNLEGWRALTTGELAVRPVAATHRAMVYAPQVQQLAAELGRCLAATTMDAAASPAALMPG